MIKRTLAVLTAAATLGVGGVAVAGASPNSSLNAASASETSTSGDTATGARASQHHRRHRIRVLRFMAKTAAETLGIDVATLRSEVREYGSVGAVASHHDSTADAVIEAIVDAGSERINAAVDKGKLNAAQASKLQARLPDAARRFVEHERKADASTAD